MPVDEKKASIHDYEVNPRYIGKGGFATVYRATHKDTGIEYAIKIINKKILVGKDSLLKRINAEVKIHIQLKHRSICELYEVFEDENSIYLVLRLCENGEFMSHLKKVGKLNENQTRYYMHQIVDGVLYLHRHNIMHRDLTLSNLLLTKEGNVMIADFGLATQITDSNPCHTTFCGTPNYLSPEVASGLPHGLSTDVWSLGVMMYTMLTGYPPFAQNSGPNETIEKVREGKWNMPDGISYFAQDLLDKLLQKDPRQRISLEQVRLHPFMMNNDAANSISAGGSGISLTRQTSIPQVAAVTAASGGIHHLSATSGSHTPRMPIIQTSASTPYTPNLSTSSSSLKMTATTASGSFNDEGNDSGLANSTASTSVSHHHTRSMTSGNANLATLNSGLEHPNFYHQQIQYSSSGSSNTSSHEHHHSQHHQQQHHNAYNNSNGNNLPLSSASLSSFRHTQQQPHIYQHPSSQQFDHLKSGSSSSSDNNNLSSSVSSPHSSSSAAPSPPLSAFTNLAIQPQNAQSQNPHQLYQQPQHHSQHSYTNQYPTNASNNISYDNNTSSSSTRQHSQSDRVKQRPGPGSQVAQSPPVKLSSYPTRDMSVNNRDNSTPPYTNMPQAQYQQQQQQQLANSVNNQMRPSSSLSQTNPNQAMYSYNQQQQEFVPPLAAPSQTRGQITSSMSMDDLTTNSRHLSFSPCPSPMPTSYAMHRSDSTSHLSSMSGVTQPQPKPQQQPQQHQSSKKPVRYEHGHTPLKFTRQVLKNTLCYTAISNVECQIEALKESKSKNMVTVKEIVRLRFDKDLIRVYKCKNPLPFNVDVMPPCPDDVPCYTIDSLPSEYWPKYTNACKFMNIIRNKTPKVTFYSDQAKATLYDTPGLFEVRFYSNSCKIVYANTFITIIKASGEEFKLTGLHSIHITEDMKPLLDQSDDMYKLCKEIEGASKIERTKKKVFPIVLGEKPRKQQQQQPIQPPLNNPAPLTKQPISQPISSSHPNLSHTQQQQLQQAKHQQQQQQQYISHQEYHQMALASMSAGGNELRSASAYSIASSTSAAPYKPNAQHQQYIANNHQPPNNHIYTTPQQQQQQQQIFSSNQQLYQQQYQQQNRSASYQRHNHLSNC